MSTSSVPRPAPATAPRAAASPRAGPHVPALDGVRGVAILLVLAYHAAGTADAAGAWVVPAAVVRLGWAGVDLFFALSGFLITGILLDTQGAPGWRRSFYIRRALRIWPLYLGVLGVLATHAWLAPAAFGLAADAAHFRANVGWYLGHAVNWRIATDGWMAGNAYATSHLWSLAIEEQFYLVWPLVLAALPRRHLGAACLAVAALSVILRALAPLTDAESVAAYVATPTRLDGLALGGWCAWAVRSPGWRLRVSAAAARWAAAPLARWGVAALALAAGLTLLVPSGAATAPRMLAVGLAIVAPCACALVLAAAHAPAGAPVARLLTARPLVWLGTVSYGLYVFHPLTLAAARRAAPPGAAATAGVVLALALAWASWRWLESPWLTLKRYVPRPPSPSPPPPTAAAPHVPA